MWVFLHGCSGLVLIWITSDYVAIGHDRGAGGLQTMLVFCAGRLARRVLRKSSGRSPLPPASNLPYSPSGELPCNKSEYSRAILSVPNRTKQRYDPPCKPSVTQEQHTRYGEKRSRKEIKKRVMIAIKFSFSFPPRTKSDVVKIIGIGGAKLEDSH